MVWNAVKCARASPKPVLLRVVGTRGSVEWRLYHAGSPGLNQRAAIGALKESARAAIPAERERFPGV
jgi:hypothetical protein